jgi:hypothetical protein
MSSEQDSLQQTTAIRDALGNVNTALASYEQVAKQYQSSEQISDKAKIAVAHNALTHDAIKLLQAVRGPLDSVYEYFEKVSRCFNCVIGEPELNFSGFPSGCHSSPHCDGSVRKDSH